MPVRRRALKRVAACVAITLAMGACGDDDEGSSGSKSSPEGGTATGTPVKIGYHSMSELADINAGFAEGLKYVNEELGGVNGRPLETLDCMTDGSPEASIDCANRFVQSRVVAAVQGFDLGTEAMLGNLKDAGIAEIGLIPLGPQAETAIGHSFFFDGPLATAGYTALLGMKGEGAEKVRFFAPDSPATRSLANDVVKPAGKKLGMDVDFLFYPYGSPEWTALVTAAKSQGAKGLGMIGGSEPECTGMMTAITQSRFEGPTLAAACKEFITALGASKVAGTMTVGGNYLPSVKDQAPAHVAANLETYERRLTKAGKKELLASDLSLFGFAQAVNVANALSQVKGDITHQSVLATMPKVKGPRFFGGEYNCDGSAWPGTTACAAEAMIMKVRPDGGRDIVGDGYMDLSQHKPKAK